MLWQTHLYIITAILNYIQYGPEETLVRLGEHSDNISELVHGAIDNNMHLSQESLEKGFISKKWQQAQTLWALRSGKTAMKKIDYWGRDLVTALQTYTYETWKHRNGLLHGDTPQEK